MQRINLLNSVTGRVLLGLFGVTLLIGFWRWSGGEAPPRYQPGFAKYISGFTGGKVSRMARPTIRFAEAVGKREAGIWPEIQPHLPGRWQWEDERTMVFEAEGLLPVDQAFTARLDLGSLLNDVPDSLSEFAFRFFTPKQAVSLAQTSVHLEEDGSYRLKGTLSLADFAQPEQVKEAVEARLAGNPLPITWSGSDAPSRLFSFEVEHIGRTEADQEMLIAANGRKLYAEASSLQKRVTIPRKEAFSLINVAVAHEEDTYLELQFSDMISMAQPMEGLFRLDGQPARYLVMGNRVRLFPKTGKVGEVSVTVAQGLKSVSGKNLATAHQQTYYFAPPRADIRLLNKGVIVPSTAQIPFTFETIGLDKVDVRVIRIFEKNIPYFLQKNHLSSHQELKRFGRIAANTTLSLTGSDTFNLNTWSRHTLDLAELVKTEPGAIYHVMIRCGLDALQGSEDLLPEKSYWGSYYGYSDQQDYYDYRAETANLLASDLGLLVKRGPDSDYFFSVTDLKTAKPISGVELELVNYQNTRIAALKTDRNGWAKQQIEQPPFLLIARKGDQRGYLHLDEGAALSMSQFAVDGQAYQEGLKGMIYAERGVWRPGDSIFVHFMVQRQYQDYPDQHPVKFQLLNPQGQLVSEIIQTQQTQGIYRFWTKTEPGAPTGTYTANVMAGGATFTQNLKIETIIPNRLKIRLDLPKEQLSRMDTDLEGQLRSSWLYGAPAKNLRATVQARFVQSGNTLFEDYPEHEFDDPLRKFGTTGWQEVFSGELDERGHAAVPIRLEMDEPAPGALSAVFSTKVFEPGGRASVDGFALPYFTYDTYVGIQTPDGDEKGMLLTDTTHQVEIVTVNADGQPVNRTDLQVSVYKLKWKWWWSKEGDNLSYIEDTYLQRLDANTLADHRERNPNFVSANKVQTKNGKAIYPFRINHPNWGRYLIRVCDGLGHCTGKIVYVDWPGWAGRSKEIAGTGKALQFSTDQEAYEVGEKVTLNIPTGFDGRALVSIESGKKVIQTHWVEAVEGITRFSFEATREMMPNVFASVTLLQPHGQTANDLPIRMYGTLPIRVVDPQTQLQPVIEMAEVLKPEGQASIRISEADGKPMAFTLAVVDEGLLNLTRYQKPDPWTHFNQKEALSILTWDVFDQVSAKLPIGNLLSIGGDGALNAKEPNRFKPLVRVFGPISLKANGSHEIRLQLPNYIGQVRAVVVAGHEQNRAYGSAEKHAYVKKPLMVLGTLPRVLSPGEQFALPVSVFATEDNLGQVKVEVATDGQLQLEGKTSLTIPFDQSGDQTVFFKVKVADGIGAGRVKITATGGGKSSTYQSRVAIRNPNPRINEVEKWAIQPGESQSLAYQPLGMDGTRTASLEVSAMTPINLEHRLNYLIRYPYGCVEQTTSSVFPQLYLSQFVELSERKKDSIQLMVSRGIQQLLGAQLTDGAFPSYPGQTGFANPWYTNYAGHFLTEAKRAGYSVPKAFFDKWLSYQRHQAQTWQGNAKDRGATANQAYRLFLLAMHNQPELAAMNRLRFAKHHLDIASYWLLIGAYHLSGQQQAARELLQDASIAPFDYEIGDATYGSAQRDQAIILYIYSLMGRFINAAEHMDKLSQALSSDQWMSSQTTAYSLVAAAHFLKGQSPDQQMQFAWQTPKAKGNASSQAMVWRTDLSPDADGEIRIQNQGKSILFARLIRSGIPAKGATEPISDRLHLEVTYRTLDGSSLDPRKLEQGTDVIAEVAVTNTSRLIVKDLALTQIFPTGWEIDNARVQDQASQYSFGSASQPVYQDIRDDRVYTYFSLEAGERKSFRVKLNAAYQGRFWLPAIQAEAMYRSDFRARWPGHWVEVLPVSIE